MAGLCVGRSEPGAHPQAHPSLHTCTHHAVFMPQRGRKATLPEPASCLPPFLACADYLELRSTLTDPALDPRLRGNGTIIYRHSLRVWQLPAFTLVGEFRTGELCRRAMHAQFFLQVQRVRSPWPPTQCRHAAGAVPPAGCRCALPLQPCWAFDV